MKVVPKIDLVEEFERLLDEAKHQLTMKADVDNFKQWLENLQMWVPMVEDDY